MALVCVATDSEMVTKWFSHNDQSRFKLERIQHILMLRSWLLSRKSIPNGEISQLVGVEGFLSRNSIESARRRRENHTRAILAEYRRQQLYGVKDDEELSKLSQTTSKRSVEIAQNTARIYWNTRNI